MTLLFIRVCYLHLYNKHLSLIIFTKNFLCSKEVGHWLQYQSKKSYFFRGSQQILFIVLRTQVNLYFYFAT